MENLKIKILTMMKDCNDPVVLQNCIELMRRSIVGMKKYGVGLNRDDFTPEDRDRHLYEELLDAVNYLQARSQTITITHPYKYEKKLQTQPQSKVYQE